MQATPPGAGTAFTDRTNPTLSIEQSGSPIVEMVKTVRVRRELVGDLPDTVSLVGGSSAATSTLDVDMRMPFAPHPLLGTDAADNLGTPVEIRAGYGGTTVPVFTGSLRQMAFDDAAGTLTYDALDGADRLRAPVTLHAFGSTSSRIKPGKVLRFPTNSSGVVVAALNAAGVRVTPAPDPARCVLSIPLVGGALADIGSTVPTTGSGIPDGDTWLTAPSAGKFGPAVNTGLSSGMMRVTGIASKAALWSDAGPTVQFEFWYYYNHTDTADVSPITVTLGLSGSLELVVAGLASANRGRVWLRSRKNTGSSWVDVTNPATGPLISTTPGWHRLAGRLSYSGLAQTWVDDDTTGPLIVSSWGSNRPLGDGPVGIAPIILDGKLQAVNLYWTNAVGVADPTPVAFTPDAVIEGVGALDIDVMPAVEGRVAWDLLKEVAAAEFGSVGFDEAGMFRFRPRSVINAVTAPVATIDTNLTGNVSGSASIDTVRTRVTSTVVQRTLIESGSNGGAVTDLATTVPAVLAGDVLVFPAGTSTHVLSARAPFMPQSGVVLPATLASAPWVTSAGMALCTDAAGVTRYTGTQVLAALSVLGPSTYLLTVVNSTASPLYAVWPSAWSGTNPFGFTTGSPAVWINGWYMVGDDQYPSTAINLKNTWSSSFAAYGDRVYALPESPWRQNVGQITDLATSILIDLQWPRVQLNPITIPADPRLQPGDVVTVNDVASKWGSRDARITSIDTLIDLKAENRIEQTLGLRALPS